MDRKAHWEHVYTTKASDEMSWYQAQPTLSVNLLREEGARAASAILDVGGGDSRLVDAVIAHSLGKVTVLDISEAALARSRERLGDLASEVSWIAADVTRAELPAGGFDFWHDRAVFHFLTRPEDRARYAAAAAAALRPGGTLLLMTFAADGPTRCSGLDVARYTPEELAEELGPAFSLVRDFETVHQTPAGQEQRFSVGVLRRR